MRQPLLTYHFGNKIELWRAAVGRLFEDLARALTERVAGLRGVDQETVARLVVADFVRSRPATPSSTGSSCRSAKTEGDRLAWLVEQHIQPLYALAVAMFDPLVAAGKVRNVPAPHLYYLLTGAVATIFVLAPECRLLTGMDPVEPSEVERHVDAVISMLFVQ